MLRSRKVCRGEEAKKDREVKDDSEISAGDNGQDESDVGKLNLACACRCISRPLATPSLHNFIVHLVCDRRYRHDGRLN